MEGVYTITYVDGDKFLVFGTEEEVTIQARRAMGYIVESIKPSTRTEIVLYKFKRKDIPMAERWADEYIESKK